MRPELYRNPDRVSLMQTEIRVGEKAVSAAICEACTFLKSAWRGQITGTCLGNSIRLRQLPEIRQ